MSVFVDNIIFIFAIMAVFWLVSQGFVYNITNGITSSFNFPLLTDGAPNIKGVLLHGFVLGVIVLILKSLITPCKEGFKETVNKKQVKK